MKLNLACGTDIKDGWVNLDVVPNWPLSRRPCDVNWDARKDRIPFDDNSAEEIYAGYLLMHISPCYHEQVLKEIHRVLSPSGVLTIGEVDMEVTMKRFLENPSDPSIYELIWGEQGTVHGNDLTEFDKHCHGFTENSLKCLLTDNKFGGFNRIRIHVSAVFYELTITCKKIDR